MRKILIYILFLLVSFPIFSQEKITDVKIDSSKIEQKKFDQKALENYKSQKDFNYNVQKKEKNILQKFWEWLGRIGKKFLSWIFDDIEPAVGVIWAILKAIPWIVLGLVLFFILKFFLKINRSNASDSQEKIPFMQRANDEEIINNQDLNALIKEAIADKDYRLAIRFYYLLVLQKLTDKELIVWQQEKTNEDFIREVAHLTLADDFTKTTRLYDFVWYGNFEIKEAEFLKAEQLFLKLIKKILG